MITLPTRQDLQKLLANTGISLPEPKSLWLPETIIWTALALIHFMVLLGMGDLLTRLWPFTN